MFSSCFLGNDMVDWILENVEGVETRDEALMFGRSLQEANYFDHVTKGKISFLCFEKCLFDIIIFGILNL
mgnify:CR=1 FL=1